jgi:nucleoside-diphosphate-sugar epimerase
MEKRSVVVFGGAGYVGSQLVPQLLQNHFDVKVFDTFWYGKKVFSSFQNHPSLQLFEGDIRDINAVSNVLKNSTDVIHLACISNDPSFDLDPKLGKSINLDSFDPLVKMAKNQGINRFIYASSSSVYGIKEELKVTEELSLHPLTDYSKFKMLCEEIILSANSPDFICTVLRPATVCGTSNRQRFDLSVNILTNHAISKNKITVYGGSQFRPNLHIEDMARAYIHILNQSKNIAGEVFNVGNENLSLDQIADKVRRVIGKQIAIEHEVTDDLRSYRVDSTKIMEKTGFQLLYKVEDAILDLKQSFTNLKFSNSLENSIYYNIKRMKELSLA